MSKYWKDMFICQNNDTEPIISYEKPDEYTDSNKKIVIQRNISKKEYDQICMFIKKNNKTNYNYTFLAKNELEKYLKFNAKILTLKYSVKETLIGCILSLPLPIKTEHDILTFGNTGFLNVHNILRNNGLSMALIKDLVNLGFEQKIYSGYFLSHKPIGTNSIPISAWYRPINLPKSIGLGYTIPDFNIPRLFAENRLKYNTKPQSGYKTFRVLKNNQDKAYMFYKNIIKNKRFAFFPDIELFSKWIQHFPTFIVKLKNNKKIVGIYSINGINAGFSDEVEGMLCIPYIFNCTSKHSKGVMKSLINTAYERHFDTLYMYEIGDLNKNCLEQTNAIKIKEEIYLSFYNTSLKFDSKDISIPLF